MSSSLCLIFCFLENIFYSVLVFFLFFFFVQEVGEKRNSESIHVLFSSRVFFFENIRLFFDGNLVKHGRFM